ncbi:unnamed protein product, partial [Thlaspi arvense]
LMASFILVSDVKHFKSMWKIKVSIMCLWKKYSAAAGLTIEMVLIDSNDHKIHATVKKENANQFDPFFLQGGSSILINFTVNHSLGSQRTTTNYHEILDGSLDQNYLIGSDDHHPIGLWGSFPTIVNDTIQARGQQSLVIVLKFAKINFLERYTNFYK